MRIAKNTKDLTIRNNENYKFITTKIIFLIKIGQMNWSVLNRTKSASDKCSGVLKILKSYKQLHKVYSKFMRDTSAQSICLRKNKAFWTRRVLLGLYLVTIKWHVFYYFINNLSTYFVVFWRYFFVICSSSSFNNSSSLLVFVSFSQILSQNSSTSFLAAVSFTVILLPLKSQYTDCKLLTNLLLMTCLV